MPSPFRSRKPQSATIAGARPRPNPRHARSDVRNARGPRPADDPARDEAGPLRLQKVLAAAGIGSRRKCEELITAGRVTVDGRTVTELGTKVDPAASDVRVDGEPLPTAKRVYYVVNKPTGVVSTNRDPAGRPRVIDLAPDGARLFAVGRLDVSSEGLILVTNDGELANRLAHPRYGVEKTYQVKVAGIPTPEVLARLRQGVHLAEGFAHAKRITIKNQHKQSAVLEMVLDEGRNREVRRLLARVGHKVMYLRRVALGPVRLGNLPVGHCRPLQRDELRALRLAARTSRPAPAELSSNAVAAAAPIAVKPIAVEPTDRRIAGRPVVNPRSRGRVPLPGKPVGNRRLFQERRQRRRVAEPR